MAVNWSDVLQAYHDNADYESSASASKAAAFLAAARRLLAGPRKIQSGSEITEFDRAVLVGQISAAQTYVNANNAAAGSVLHTSLEGGW